MQYFLESETVGMRKLEASDATEAYAGWLNDRDVTRHLVSGIFPTASADLADFIRGANSDKRVTLAICRKPDGRHVGNCKLDHIDWVSRKAELGILIGDKSAWGSGIGTEAVRLLTEYALVRLNLERVWLGVVAENRAAVRVYEKLGYVVEGTKIGDQYIDGQRVDTLMMAVSREAFVAAKSRVVVVVQARMSSTRLPGKVLRPIAGTPAILGLVERLRAVKRAAHIVVATSRDSSDDALCEALRPHHIDVVRGDLPNVLSRFVDAAKHARADVVVRITGDCPLHDPALIDHAIALFHANRSRVDYVSNVDERTYPDGFDVEVFSAAALYQAHAQASSVFEREHVTPWLRRHVAKLSFAQTTDLSALRLTLDTAEDYRCIDAVAQHIAANSHGPERFAVARVYEALLSQPTLLQTAESRALNSDEQRAWCARLEQALASPRAGAAL